MAVATVPIVDVLTEQIDDALDELEMQMARGHTQGYLDMLAFHAKLHKYSISNAILIAIQKPHATVVAGYRRWSDLGFHVKRGERGIAIRAPMIRKIVDKDTGEIEERLVGYRETWIWDISQTVEYPEKQPPSIFQPIPGDWFELFTILRIHIGAQGVLVTEDPMPADVHGMYAEDHIYISARLDPFFKVTCVLHEYVHHLAHRERDDTTRQDREFIAESVTFVVCAIIGIRHDTAADYLLSYACNPEHVRQNVKQVQRLVKQVCKDLRLAQEVTPKKEQVAA